MEKMYCLKDVQTGLYVTLKDEVISFKHNNISVFSEKWKVEELLIIEHYREQLKSKYIEIVEVYRL